MSHQMYTTGEQQPFTWKGGPGYKPLYLLLAAVLFIAIVVMPPPQGMVDMVSKTNPPGYALGKNCTTITETVNQKLRPDAKMAEEGNASEDHGGHGKALLTPEEVAGMAKTTVCPYYSWRLFYGGPKHFPLALRTLWWG